MESGGVEGEERRQAWGQLLEPGRVALVAIPGTGLLAEVAAENPVVELRPQRHGNRAPVLDGEVRDTAPRIHRIPIERTGRAGRDAAGTRAAVVGGQRDGVEREVGEQLGEEEVGASGAMEDERVLPDPAEAGARPPLPLEHRPGVDVGTEARARKDVVETRDQALEKRSHALVIVGAERVGGDAPAELGPPVARRWRRGAIRIRE